MAGSGALGRRDGLPTGAPPSNPPMPKISTRDKAVKAVLHGVTFAGVRLGAGVLRRLGANRPAVSSSRGQCHACAAISVSTRQRPARPDGDQSKRRRFLATALASAAILSLPGCESPRFDPNTTTLTFRRRSPRGSGRN
jgi:hypothetical protein